MIWFLIAATALVTVVTTVPLLRHQGWWVRIFDFPRLQFAVLAITVLALCGLLLDTGRPGTWILIAVNAACFANQAWWILPYTRLSPVETRAAAAEDAGDRIRIMTANVLKPNRDAGRLLALVRDFAPQVLVTLESDAWWESALSELERDYPYTIRCPLDNLYGMHVWSRWALRDSRIEYLVEPDVPSMHAALELPSGAQVRMHFLHPAPPSPTENEASAERDAELVMVARNIAGSDQPIIVTGDLNDVAWSQTTRLFRKLSGLLDPRVGRGMFNTFHAGHVLLRWPLDHLYHSDHFTLGLMRRLPPFGSDHFALLTELVYAPRRGSANNGLRADGDDHAWAEDTLADQHVDADQVPDPSGRRAPGGA